MKDEGPGQPRIRRSQGLGFIVEWDKVVSPFLDRLIILSKVTIVSFLDLVSHRLARQDRT